MVWVDDGEGGLVGGGTEFPALRRPADRRWCRFVECGGGNGTGAGQVRANGGEGGEGGGGVGNGEKGEEEVAKTVFKPLVGNAVYWENFRADGTGRGYEETCHAGLPVVEGVKVGLNIWSWGRLE